MTFDQILLSGASAAIVVLGATECAVWAVTAFRRREYNRRKESEDALIAQLAQQIPSIDTDAHSLFRRAARWMVPHHDFAIKMQSRYHAALTRSVVGLAIALVILVVALIGFPDYHGLHLFAAVSELIALLSVLINHRFGMRRIRDWLRARVRAEVIRQAGFFEAMRGDEIEEKRPPSFWEKGVDALDLADTPISDVPRKLRAFWAQVRNQIDEAYLPSETLFHAYLRLRAVRQIAWFNISLERIKTGAKRREMVLRVLYYSSLFLATLKVLVMIEAFSVPLGTEKVISVVLLSLVAAASALTAFYLGSNQRSLSHRYAIQIKKIVPWFATARENCESQFDKHIALEQVFDFEELMLEELVDWVEITGEDTFELAL